MGNNLTGQQISATYEQLVQISGSILTDGTGSNITSLDITASNAVTASLANNATSASFATSASYALTASYAENANIDTGSFMVTASAVSNIITFEKADGSTFDVTVAQSGSVDSASYATFAATAGVANTASYVLGSNVNGTVASATSASYALTSTSASHALVADSAGTATSASHAVNADSAISSSHAVNADISVSSSFSSTALSASYSATATSASHAVNADVAISSSYALTASFAENATDVNALYTASVVDATISFLKGGGGTFPITVNNVINADSASVAVSASYALTSTSASHALNSDVAISASHAVNADTASIATSASYALTASYLEGGVSTQDLQSVTSVGATTSASVSIIDGGNFEVSGSGIISVNGSGYVQVADNTTSNGVLGPNYLAFNSVDDTTPQLIDFYDSSGFNSSGISVNPANLELDVFTYNNARIRLGSDTQVTGSLNVTAGITGSLEGTASYALQALSASFATTASYALNATPTDTGSLMVTGSVAGNVLTFTKGDASTFDLTVDTGSASIPTLQQVTTAGAITSESIQITDGIVANATILGTGNAITLNSIDGTSPMAFDFADASAFNYGGMGFDPATSIVNIYANGGTVKIENDTQVTGSLNVSGGITGSLNGTASFATAATSASHAVDADSAISSSFSTTAISASHAVNADTTISASFASTAISASHSVNSDTSISASFAATATSASHAVNADSAISASYAPSTTPNLQDVTSIGAITSESIQITDATTGNNILGPTFVSLNSVDNTTALEVNFTDNNGFDFSGVRFDPATFGLDIFTYNNAPISLKSPTQVTGSLDINGGIIGNGGAQFTDATTANTIIASTGQAVSINSIDNTSLLEYSFTDNNGLDTSGVRFDPATFALDVYTYNNARIALTSDTQVTGSLNVSGGITGSLLGTASYATNALSSSYALTASYVEGGVAAFPYTGSAQITGSLVVTGSYSRLSGSFSGSLIDNITDVYTTSPSIEHVISLTQAEYNAVSASADPNTLYYITDAVSSVVSASYALSSSYALSASFATTASFYSLANVNQDVVITGSVRGNVSSLLIGSDTASIDLSNGNFFDLTIVSGSNTHIDFSNIAPGQTVNLKVNQPNPGNGTVSFPSYVKQVSGSAYVPTTGSGATDIVTFITFDSTNLYLSNVKNLV
jgi:hypothetical protein